MCVSVWRILSLSPGSAYKPELSLGIPVAILFSVSPAVRRGKMSGSRALLCALLVAALAVAAGAAKPQPCCHGENAITKKTENDSASCTGGGSITLTCPHKALLSKEGVQEAGWLGPNQELFNIDDYCISTIASTQDTIYIICYDPDENESSQGINSLLGFISDFFIILTIIVYLVVPGLLDLQGILMVHSLMGLGIGYFTLGLLHFLPPLETALCVVLASFVYVSFLYAFFWLNVLSFNIWRVTVNPKLLRFTNRWLPIYHLFAIGGTAACLTVLLVAEYGDLPHFEHVKPKFGVSSCWFRNARESLIYFYTPISVLLVANMMYFLWTAIVLWQTMKHSLSMRTNSLKHRLTLCAKLVVIMGVTWIFEIISAVTEYTMGHDSLLTPVWIITDALNALQGLIIFLILVVFRKKIRRCLANKKVCGVKFPARWRTIPNEESCSSNEDDLGMTVVPLAQMNNDDNMANGNAQKIGS